MDMFADCSAIKNEEAPPDSDLLPKILNKCDNAMILGITKLHLNILLKYAKQVEMRGFAAFATKEEYHDLAIAKFYVDKCIDSVKKKSEHKEIEEGEIDSDTEDQRGEKPVGKNEETPPLEAFHISAQEKKMRLYNFWQDIKEGDLFHVKVRNRYDKAYDLLIVNKYLEEKRLIDLDISACMKLSSCKENLCVGDIVRVSVTGFAKGDSGLKVVVIADASMLMVKMEHPVHLGKISATELPFPPFEASKFRSLTHYVPLRNINRDPRTSIQGIKALGIDPYGSYSVLPELDGLKGAKVKERKGDYPEEVLKSIELLKMAMVFKVKGDVTRALYNVNRALQLNPKYDLALAVRGCLMEMKCDGKSSSSLLSAFNDFNAALKLNSQCHLALRGMNKLLLKSARLFLNEGSIDRAEENLEYAQCLSVDNKASDMMVEVSIHRRLQSAKNASKS